MFDQHTNFPISEVAVAPVPADTGTTAILSAGDGADMPTPPFNGVFWPANDVPRKTNATIVRVTGVSGDELTFTRSQEGSSNISITVGDQFAAPLTVKSIRDIEAWIESHAVDYTNPHRVTAAQVGAIPVTAEGQPLGVATLDNTGKVPAGQLPASGGEANDGQNTGATGVPVYGGKSGIHLLFKKLVALSGKISITDDTASGTIDLDVAVTKTDVGLGNVTNDAQVKRTEMGAANGVATLDAGSKLPHAQLPAIGEADITGLIADLAAKITKPADAVGYLHDDGAGNLSWGTPAGGGGGGQTTVTKVVAPSGGDYTTLSAALAAATDGWHIQIMPGTYTEAGATSVANNLTITGSSPDAVVLDLGANTLEFDGTNTTFTGITVTCAAGNINFVGANSTIIGNKFLQTATTGSMFLQIYGTYSRAISNYIDSASRTTGAGTISCCRIGAYVYFAGNIVLANPGDTSNAYNTQGAVSSRDGAGSKIIGNMFQFRDNISGRQPAPMLVIGGNNTVSGNYFYNSYGGTGCITHLLAGYTTGGVISGNVFSGNTGNNDFGINLLGGYFEVIGNYFTNFYQAIAASSADHTSIANNTFYNVNYAVYNSSASYQSITGNAVQSNYSSDASIYCYGADCTISNNVIQFQGGQHAIFAGGPNISIIGNAVKAVSGSAIAIVAGGGSSAVNSNSVDQTTSAGTGIQIYGSNNVANGNTLKSVAANAGTGIEVNASNNVVTGNRSMNYGTGINIVSGTNSIVTSNNCTGSTTNITDAGTTTVLANNV